MKAVEWISTVPWCITESALEAMVSIAERAPLADAAERLHGPQSLALRPASRRDDSRRMEMRDGVALLRIDGPIYRYADFFSEVSGGVTTEALARDLQLALDDSRVEAVLLVVDSPGGEATGIGELADAIAAGRSQKPIWAYVEGYGASAALWLASAAERVVVDASALLGSIGTVLRVPNPAAAASPARVVEVVSSQSPKKRLDPTTQAGRDELQRLADDLTEVFIGAVQRNRGLSRDQVLALEGGLRIGQQAVDAGLADAVGAEEATLTALQQEAAARRARPAHPSPRQLAAHPQEIESMNLRQMFAAMFGAAQDAGVITPDEAPVAPATAADAAPAVPADVPADAAPAVDAAAQAAELEQLKAALAAREQAAATAVADQREQAAVAFAAQLVRENRATPAEATAIAAAHREAAAAGPAVLAAIEAAYRVRPAHALTQEAVPADAAGVLPLARPDAGAEPPLTAEDVRALLALTPLGKAALAAKSAE